jgi:hypothetical protein
VTQDEISDPVTDLEAANYPPQGIEVIEREQGKIELVVTLLGTAADPRESSMTSSHASRQSARGKR